MVNQYKPSVVSAQVPEVADSRNAMVREDRRIVVEEYDNVRLKNGQSLSILNIAEAGELISVQVTTDNPYAAVQLEVDDFRKKGIINTRQAMRKNTLPNIPQKLPILAIRKPIAEIRNKTQPKRFI